MAVRGTIDAAATGGLVTSVTNSDGTLTISPTTGAVVASIALGHANTWTALQTNEGATGTSPGWYAQMAGDTVPRIRVGLNASDVASIGFGPGNAVRDAFIERSGAGSLRFPFDASNYLNITVSSNGGVTFNAQGAATGDTMTFQTSGTTRFTIDDAAAYFRGTGSSSAMISGVNASSTSPTLVPNRNDITTGIGAQASGNISAIVGAAEVARFTSTGINNAAIGATTASTGAFTTLTASTANGFRILSTSSPASNGTGVTGSITWDASYIYVCTGTDTWARAALTGGY